MENNNIDKKLEINKYKPDTKSHLVPNIAKCKNCKEKPCTFICPAKVYLDMEGEIIVQYENCLECGACRIVCENITWDYPSAGYGVIYKHS